MHTDSIDFIQDLAIVMLIAGFMTVLCHRFRQPIVLGYLIAGIIIGPYTPPFALIHNEETIRTMAGLGLIFIMFSLGLEFNLRKLSKLGASVIIIALLEIIFMTLIGYGTGKAFGWSFIDSIFLGTMLAISSTTIIIKALDELNLKHENFAQLIFGILILEDIFAIVIIALLYSVAITGAFHPQAVMTTLGELLSFLVVSLVVGILTIPRFLSYVARFKSKELLLITVLGFCFGFCLIAMKLNYSLALGAFVIGAIMAESSQLPVIESLVASLRDMFSALFFVSIGLLFDPEVLMTHLGPTVIIALIVIVGKVFSCASGALASGHDGKTSLKIGMGMAQVGEFSFIIAGLGIVLNVSSPFLYPIAIIVSVITTLLTPYLIRYSDPFAQQLSQLLPQQTINGFHRYQQWLHRKRQHHHPEKIRKIIYRCIFQLLINLFIIMALFFSASFIETTLLGNYLAQTIGKTLGSGLLWFLALTLSLPCLLACYQTLKAVIMLVIRFDHDKKPTRLMRALQRVLIEITPFVVLALMMVAVSAFNRNIVPPIELQVAILLAMSLLLILFRTTFIKLYTYLQIHLLAAMHREE